MRARRVTTRELIHHGRRLAHARQINANALTFNAIVQEWIDKKCSR
jgi:hypothetical protein